MCGQEGCPVVAGIVQKQSKCTHLLDLCRMKHKGEDSVQPDSLQPIDLYGAGTVNRTPDLRITNALLYQLSYVGTWKGGQYIQNPSFAQYHSDF